MDYDNDPEPRDPQAMRIVELEREVRNLELRLEVEVRANDSALRLAAAHAAELRRELESAQAETKRLGALLARVHCLLLDRNAKRDEWRVANALEALKDSGPSGAAAKEQTDAAPEEAAKLGPRGGANTLRPLAAPGPGATKGKP